MGKHGAAAFALHCFIIHGIYHVNEKSIVMDMELRLERLDIDIDFFVGLVDFKLHRHAVITRLTAGPVPSVSCLHLQ